MRVGRARPRAPAVRLHTNPPSLAGWLGRSDSGRSLPRVGRRRRPRARTASAAQPRQPLPHGAVSRRRDAADPPWPSPPLRPHPHRVHPLPCRRPNGRCRAHRRAGVAVSSAPPPRPASDDVTRVDTGSQVNASPPAAPLSRSLPHGGCVDVRERAARPAAPCPVGGTRVPLAGREGVGERREGWAMLAGCKGWVPAVSRSLPVPTPPADPPSIRAGQQRLRSKA